MIPIRLFNSINPSEASVLTDKLNRIVEAGNLAQMKAVCLTDVSKLDPEYVLSQRCDQDTFASYLRSITEALHWIAIGIDPNQRNSEDQSLIAVFLSNIARHKILGTDEDFIVVRWDFQDFNFGSYIGKIKKAGRGAITEWMVTEQVS